MEKVNTIADLKKQVFISVIEAEKLNSTEESLRQLLSKDCPISFEPNIATALRKNLSLVVAAKNTEKSRYKKEAKKKFWDLVKEEFKKAKLSFTCKYKKYALTIQSSKVQTEKDVVLSYQGEKLQTLFAFKDNLLKFEVVIEDGRGGREHYLLTINMVTSEVTYEGFDFYSPEDPPFDPRWEKIQDIERVKREIAIYH